MPNFKLKKQATKKYVQPVWQSDIHVWVLTTNTEFMQCAMILLVWTTGEGYSTYRAIHLQGKWFNTIHSKQETTTAHSLAAPNQHQQHPLNNSSAHLTIAAITQQHPYKPAPTYLFYDVPCPFCLLLSNLFSLDSLCEFLTKREMCLQQTADRGYSQMGIIESTNRPHENRPLTTP